ncbi:MAG: sigma-70 family RNA polymerase sigma factor [Patescibacteria group bacterium]
MRKSRDNATRTTLLRRVKNPEDAASWQTFQDIYGNLIYGQAIKAGLTEDESKEAVQETMIELAERIKTFDYRKENGSFKGWLYRLARWRILAQFRRRRPAALPVEEVAFEEFTPAELTTAPADQWEHEWREALMTAALQKLRHDLPLKHYQVFDLVTLKAWPVARVARSLKMSRPQVYLVKFRVLISLKREVTRLEKLAR